MNAELIPQTALISAFVTLIGTLIATLKWRRELEFKLKGFRDEVTSDLIKRRVECNEEFLSRLEPLSQSHKDELEKDKERVKKYSLLFHEAMYGKVGLLASNHTRVVIGWARKACVLYSEEKIGFEEFIKHIWAVHIGIRSDIGIPQKLHDWPSEIDSKGKAANEFSEEEILSQIRNIKPHTYELVGIDKIR